MGRAGLLAAAALALAAAVLVATMALAAPARAGAQGFYGVVNQGALGDGDYERMRAANAGPLRFLISWQTVERSPGTYRWDRTDELIGNAAARGITVLPFVHGRPPAGVSNPPTSASDRQAFRRFMVALVSRYGPGGEYWELPYLLQHPLGSDDPPPVTTWQIGNEQNGRFHWGAPAAPRAYGRLVRAGAAGVRSVHPEAEIVLGGMFATPSGRGGLLSWRFLNRLYRVRGIKEAFDTVAVHPYAPGLRGIRIQMRRIRQVMRRNGDGATPIRVTEIGWGSERGRHGLLKGPQRQARMLTRSFRLLTRHRERRRGWNVAGVNWFSWQDGSARCPFCASSGLFRGEAGDRRAKPSWQAFTQFLR